MVKESIAQNINCLFNGFKMRIFTAPEDITRELPTTSTMVMFIF